MASLTDEQLMQAATDPNRVSVDGMSVDAPSASDVIAIDKYMSAKAAAKSRKFPLKRFQMVAPGTVGQRSE
jgi:hypothetical protein